MKYRPNTQHSIEREVADFYRHALSVLRDNRISFLVGGAYALQWHTGIHHPTKDLDLMVQPADCPRALRAMEFAGYRTELTFSHWLAKVFHNGAFIDIIFNSGNGLIPVARDWFRYAVRGKVCGLVVDIISPVELLWSKAFVMERERYDGADVLHLIRACGADLDWPRLVKRFGADWPVLFSHLVLFKYVYPSEGTSVPKWVMQLLMGRMQSEVKRSGRAPRICRGTLLSREQYLIDIEQARYSDPRLEPHGNMSREEVARWTDAIEKRNGAKIQRKS
jgi:hypothetical protein